MDDINLWTSWSDMAWVVVSAIAIYLWILLTLRLNGLRTLASFSGYDVVVSVAIGSITASAGLSKSISLAAGMVAVAVLVGCQRLLTMLRRNERAQRAVDNMPILLIAKGTLLHDNMDAAGVTLDDIRQKLRQGGASRLDQVELAVFETTGDISVLLAPDAPVDPSLFEGVRDFDRYLDTVDTGAG